MDYININLTSYHFNNIPRNERNIGIGYERNIKDIRYMTGIYRNSFNRNTVYALAGYTPIHKFHMDFGVIGGAVTGYRPYPVPAAGFFMADDRINVFAIPPVKKMEGFLALQLKFKWR